MEMRVREKMPQHCSWFDVRAALARLTAKFKGESGDKMMIIIKIMIIVVSMIIIIIMMIMVSGKSGKHCKNQMNQRLVNGSIAQKLIEILQGPKYLLFENGPSKVISFSLT